MTHRFSLPAWLVVPITVLVLSSCGGGGGDGDSGSSGGSTTPPVQSATPGVLSITATPQQVPALITSAQVATANTAAANMAYGTGARGQEATYTWLELEPSPRSYDAAKLADLANSILRAQTLSLTEYVGIQVINTSVKSLPADLNDRDFDDPVVIARFHALLDQVVGTHRGQIRYLSIGNEVDAYLSTHASAIAPYQAFYQDAAAYARGLDSALQVGVTGTADGALGNNAAILSNLNVAASDVVILTYYPLVITPTGVTVRDPSGVPSDFTRMLAFAGAKPLVLQEVGYPAAASTNSSEAMQATFVRQVFTSWQAAGGRIPFLNYFLLHDFTATTCASLVTYYGLPNVPSFPDYLCSLGLIQVDGTQRQAYPAFVTAAKQAGFTQ